MAEVMQTKFQDAVDAGTINGVVICATDATGRFVYNKVIGHRTLVSGEKKSQQIDDVLFLASGTKLITTVAALQCVEDGLLTLDGDLSSVAPEMTAEQVLTGWSEDGEGRPVLEAPKRPITLEMLLTHSAGTSYDFTDGRIGRWRKEFGTKSTSGETKPRPVEEALRYPLSYQPGTGWMYGVGLDWAGRIVERVTGKTLDDCVRERIWTPLGITDASFHPVTDPGMQARQVDRNPDDPDGAGRAVAGGSANLHEGLRGNFGGHGLFMAGCDYVKVLRSLLANDGKLLRPATVDDMFENHLSPEATAAHRAALESPMGVFFRNGVDLSTKTGHGLGGLLTLEDVEGLYGERTLSWIGGLTLTWFVDRKNDLCGVGAVQATQAVDVGKVTELKQVFRTGVYREKEIWKKRS